MIQANPTAQPPAPVAIDAERKSRLSSARRKSAAFGQIVALMARSQPHSKLPIGDLNWLIGPPVQAGQFLLAGKRLRENGMVEPVTALVWASVSDAIDKQLVSATTPMRLDPEAWTSGDKIWLVEVVGDAKLLPEMIKRLGGAEWRGKTIKLRQRSADGVYTVRAVGPL